MVKMRGTICHNSFLLECDDETENQVTTLINETCFKCDLYEDSQTFEFERKRRKFIG